MKTPKRIKFELDYLPTDQPSVGYWEVRSPNIPSLRELGRTIPEALANAGTAVGRMMLAAYDTPDMPSVFVDTSHDRDCAHKHWDRDRLGDIVSRLMASRPLPVAHPQDNDRWEAVAKKLSAQHPMATMPSPDRDDDRWDAVAKVLSDIRSMVERIHSRGPGQGDQILAILKSVEDKLSKPSTIENDVLNGIFGGLDRLADRGNQHHNVLLQMLNRIDSQGMKTTGQNQEIARSVAVMASATQNLDQVIKWVGEVSKAVDVQMKFINDVVQTMLRVMGGDRGAGFIKMVLDAVSSAPEFTYEGVTWVRKSIGETPTPASHTWINAEPG